MNLVRARRMLYPGILIVFGLVFGLVFGNAVAYAQGGSTGSLAGTVADQSGAVVTNASVIVKSNDTGQQFTTVTSGSGTFNVPSLGTGTYTLAITAQGFKQALISAARPWTF